MKKTVINEIFLNNFIKKTRIRLLTMLAVHQTKKNCKLFK
jgi:hypothetical protein